MRSLLLGAAVLAAVYGLHRCATWAECRGWIYYRRKRGSSGTLSNAVLEVHSLFDPSKQYILEEKRRDQVEDGESGDPPARGTRRPPVADPD